MDSDDDYEYSDDGSDGSVNGNNEKENPNQASFCSALSDSSGLGKSPAGASFMGLASHGSSSMSLSEGTYRFMDAEEIIPVFTSLVMEVSTLMDIDSPQAEILLMAKKWNKENLMNSFFEDPEKLKEKSGLKLYNAAIAKSIDDMVVSKDKDGETRAHRPASSSSTPKRAEGKTDGDEDRNGQYYCRICRGEQPVEEAVYMGCDHKFCAECYKGYLENAVGSGPACILSQCPEHKCEEALPSSIFKKLCSEGSFKRYQQFLLRNYVEQSKTQRFCPAPGCEKIVIGTGVRSVTCTCGHDFCFKCGEEAHEPTSCHQLGMWAEKCQSESETANWILVNTKKCPKCDSRIEKNQGCNHIHCKLCHHDFCWMCMGAWGQHDQATGGYYKCNRYDPNKPADGDESRAKQELDRYLHYYRRYHGHEDSLKYAQKDRVKAEQRMLERQESDKSTWMEVQFLKNATDQVIECRRVLKYTYVLGFYLDDASPDKTLFEHHQEMLEKHTEMLHGLTETSVEKLDSSHVVNVTRITEKFLAGLLATCQGGYINQEAAAAMEPV
jgi:ariadne-1